MARWITPKKRLAIYLRDRFTCIYCLRDLHDADCRDITLDHLIPRSDKGGNEAKNLVTACLNCNSSRQDKPLSRFCGPETRKHIRRNIKRSMRKYLKLAEAIMDGSINHEDIRY
jgi:5-methylcytosine-specific restriction endonuclease McrA